MDADNDIAFAGSRIEKKNEALSEVLILMATHNGGCFLAEQLESIARQSHSNWQLWISDDASSDQTLQIIQNFINYQPEGRVRLLPGPRQGATENFRSLLRRADLQQRYLAFCDQDDVWDSDHLSRGLSTLGQLSRELGIYGCRMRICDIALNQIGYSSRPTRSLSFRNALVQNMLSGNTMILTPAAATLLQQAEIEAGPVLLHDWWAYQLITGAGGTAFWDNKPGLSYRQHDGNVIGAKQGLRSLLARLRRHMQGDHKQWVEQNSAALATSATWLTPENRQVLACFTEALTAPLPRKVAMLRRSGVYYQSPQVQAIFWICVIFGGL